MMGGYIDADDMDVFDDNLVESAAVASAGECIPQAMIEEYMALDQPRRRWQALKDELTRRLRRGVPVELGRHQVRLVRRTWQRLTVDWLLERLGVSDEQVATLRAQVPVQERVYLDVLCPPEEPTSPVNSQLAIGTDEVPRKEF